ncbi:MAG: very short patch repair endonuclease [Gammaproteobacteria bacterium]|nr:very short patch repair endonuclease [Gammaproteobacteria bacterium]MDE0246601.1 very short patch repair endonuclease [Gammaproteobacteria bacterium]
MTVDDRGFCVAQTDACRTRLRSWRLQVLSCDAGGKMDPFPPEVRRRVMQAVRRKDTEPEMTLRRALWSAGLRYRLGRRIAGTRPDLCFLGAKVAVFVDGCFWHGCPDHYSAPTHNFSYWNEKLRKNQARDRRDDHRLAAAGWSVLRYWECEVQEEARRIVEEVQCWVRGPARDLHRSGDTPVVERALEDGMVRDRRRSY